MASTQVSFLDLLPAGPITGTEVVAIVQDGWSVKTTTAALAGSPVQTQSFLTVNNEPSLNNSRQLAVGAGMSLADGGIQAALQINLTGALTNLNGLGTGIMVKTGVSTMAPRVFTTSGNGLSVANGDGIAGNPTLQLTGLPAALAAASGTGMLAIVGGTTIANRTLTGTANQIAVTDGNGANNPAISLSSNPIIPGLAGLTLPVGATADRSVSAGVGTIRYNTSANSFEGYTATGWGFIVAGAAVTSFSAGTTGLTPGTASTGAIVLGGILNVVNGGSGTATPALVAGSNVTITGTWPNQTINSSNPGGTVTSVTGTAPVVSSGGTTPAISMAAATTSVNGYLTSTDWTTFNSKQPAGTYVNSVSGTTGRITSTGGVTPVIDLASGIATAGTTGSATLIPVVTIDTYGRVTTITTAANPQGTVTSVGGTGTVNGITLTGTVTSTGSLTLGGTLSSIANSQLSNSAITINGSAVSLGGSITVTATASNALTIGTGLSGTSYNGSAAVTIALASTTVTAATYGSASSVPVFAVNAQGQLTSVTDTAIAIANTAVSGLGTMSTQNANAVAITGGAIDGATIGATTATTGKFTTVSTTGAGSDATGGGQVYLNGTTSNRIDFNTEGVAAPTTTTRSAGTKLTLYPALSDSQTDYAVGIAAATLWASVPVNSSSFYFKWYGGATEVASLDGTGKFNAINGISGGTF